MFGRLQRGISELSWRVTSWVVRRTHARTQVSGIEVFYESDHFRGLADSALGLLDQPSVALVRRHLRRVVELPTAEVRISPRLGLLGLNCQEWSSNSRIWAVGLVMMAAVCRAGVQPESQERQKAVWRWGLRAAAHLEPSKEETDHLGDFISAVAGGRWSTLKKH